MQRLTRLRCRETCAQAWTPCRPLLHSSTLPPHPIDATCCAGYISQNGLKHGRHGLLKRSKLLHAEPNCHRCEAQRHDTGDVGALLRRSFGNIVTLLVRGLRALVRDERSDLLCEIYPHGLVTGLTKIGDVRPCDNVLPHDAEQLSHRADECNAPPGMKGLRCHRGVEL